MCVSACWIVCPILSDRVDKMFPTEGMGGSPYWGMGELPPNRKKIPLNNNFHVITQ